MAVDEGSMVLPKSVDADSFHPMLPVEAQIAVGLLTLSWGAYDSAVTYWLAKTLGMPLEAASIVFGLMDTGSKLVRLKNLHDHYGVGDASTGLKQLRDAHEKRVVARNTVAHSRCVGVLKSAPDHLAFSAVKHMKGEPGMLAVQIVPLSEIRLAERFANATAKSIMEFASNMPAVVPPSDGCE